MDACDAWRAALTMEEIRALGWDLTGGGWRKHFGHVPVVVFPLRRGDLGRFRLVYETAEEEHDRHLFEDLWSAVEAAERRFRLPAPPCSSDFVPPEGVSEEELLRAWLGDELAARAMRLRIYRDGAAWRHPDYGIIARPHGAGWWTAHVVSGGNDLFNTLPKTIDAICRWVERARNSRGTMSTEYRP